MKIVCSFILASPPAYDYPLLSLWQPLAAIIRYPKSIKKIEGPKTYPVPPHPIPSNFRGLSMPINLKPPEPLPKGTKH
ncbi:uncharacterized protein METZ01_LOCUS268841, partial [marine metagenome]